MTAHKSYSATVGGTKAQVSGQIATMTALNFLNTTAAVAYVQMFFRTSGDVTVGTTVPDMAIGLPASAGLTLSFPDGWMLGGYGLTVACCTTDTGNTGANVKVNFVLA